MIQLTVAISDFMVMLIGAALWLALGIGAMIVVGLVAAGVLWLLCRGCWRRLRRYMSSTRRP